MESTLLSHSLFAPFQNRNLGYLERKLQSSFYGKMVFHNSSLIRRRDIKNCNPIGLRIYSLFGNKGKTKAVKKETVVPEPDYRIPIVLLGLSGGLIYGDNVVAAVPFGLLGLLLLVQATRVRFVFDDEALEVKVGEQLEESGENVFVGGKNRWKYSTFVNWELWWPGFPILVYFKETQTKPEGQIHFFPVIFNGKQLYDVMVERCGTSQTSTPKSS